jgi:hypothetical protein
MTNSQDTTELAVLNARLAALHSDVGEMKSVLLKLTDAIHKLALIEQQQIQTAASVERSFKMIEKLESRLERNEAKLSLVEVQMPMVSRTSGWVEKLLLAAAGAVLMLIFKLATAGGAL